MNPRLAELINTIQQAQSQTSDVEMLHLWCAVNSGSDNLAGLDHMANILSDAFSLIADSTEKHCFPPVPTWDMTGQATQLAVGPALLFRKRPAVSQRILLCGHMDTVYGLHHPFQTLKTFDKNTLIGPGVADMKGGLLVILQALTAFEKLDCANNLGWDVLINSDEEIGSPASRFLIDQLAPQYQAALVYEPAMDPEGTFAKNRRGSGKFTLVATGVASHVGRAFDQGRNAIVHLAQAVLAIHALNQERPEVTINVGKIAGGEALNVVPAKAVAKLDIRIRSAEDEAWVHQKLKAILSQLKHPDYQLELHGQFERPIKLIDSGTQRLFQRIQAAGKQLGLSLTWQDSGGCCDGNNLAQHKIPVIDTLGVRGGQIHTPEEFIRLDSLSERIALSLLILNDLANGGLQELTQ